MASFVSFRGVLIDWQVALTSRSVGSDPGYVITGTILYTAISVLLELPNTVSSDLESLMYTLVSIACDGKLPWRHARSEDEVLGSKFRLLTNPSARSAALGRLEANSDLLPLVDNLWDLFLADDGQGYCSSVSPEDFISVCEDGLEKLQKHMVTNPDSEATEPPHPMRSGPRPAHYSSSVSHKRF